MGDSPVGIALLVGVILAAVVAPVVTLRHLATAARRRARRRDR